MQTIATAGVDETWKATPDTTDGGSMWFLPLVIVGMVVAAMIVQKRPWVLLALGLSLILLIPLGSYLFR